MNYIILDHNQTFISQFTGIVEATIFIIRDEFNLQGTTVNVPDGSILRFEGGSIQNGTIASNDCHIEAPLIKVFSGIIFQGTFLNGQIFEIEWFVSQYENSFVLDSSKNAAPEINDALACGAKTMRFNNCRYYPIATIILVNGTIDIIGKTRYCDSPSWGGERQPCIYNTQSSRITTLLEYTFHNTENPYKTRLNIEGLNFYYTKGSSPQDIDVLNSIVKITRIPDANVQEGESTLTLWGLYINININATHNNSFRTSFFNGLEVFANNASITYIEVHGYIANVYNAYKFWKEGSCYITDTKIYGNTYCVRGGDFDGGYPVRNYGSHQPIYYFERENQIAYFNAVQFENYGYVWDLGYSPDNTNYACRYLAKPISNGFVYDGSQKKYSPVAIEVPSDFIYPNLLADNTIKCGSSFGSDPAFSVRTNTVITCHDSNNNEITYGDNETVEQHLQFKRYRFPKRITRWDSTYLYASKRSDIGYSFNGDNNLIYDYNVIILIERTNNMGWYQDRPPLYICPSDPRKDFNVKVEYFKLDSNSESIDNTNPIETIEFNRNDVNPYDYGKYIKVADIFFRVTQEQLSSKLVSRVTYSQKLSNTQLITRPMFYIPNYHATDIVRGGTELVSLTQYDKGETYYHENYGLLTWDGESWREQDGAKAGVKRNGTFEERPTSENIYVGFKYFCTSNVIINRTSKSNLPIFFNGNHWVDSNGDSISTLI